LRSPQGKLISVTPRKKRAGHLAGQESMSHAIYYFHLKSLTYRGNSGKAEGRKANPAALRKFLAFGKTG
jgi:hypothetical protein